MLVQNVFTSAISKTQKMLACIHSSVKEGLEIYEKRVLVFACKTGKEGMDFIDKRINPNIPNEQITAIRKPKDGFPIKLLHFIQFRSLRILTSFLGVYFPHSHALS